MKRALLALALLLVLAFAGVYAAGRGWLGELWDAGEVSEARVPRAITEGRSAAQRADARAVGVAGSGQVLFGDFHVHTSFSADAFMLSLPLAGGEGANTIADACDFARFCAGLDFWSINDHAESSTPRRWRQTVDAIRRCNAVGAEPDLPGTMAFLGWEWSHMGTRPENHFGHKNVVLRDLEDDAIPKRPIAADSPANYFRGYPALGLGLLPILRQDLVYLDAAANMQEVGGVPRCPAGVPVRELPDDCREYAASPAELFAKLDDWGHASLVIPHGTTWGMYTPTGADAAKQLRGGNHDPERQRLAEVYSGHGNTEEYRAWRGAALGPEGERLCPEPSHDYLPTCWQAGEIVRARCLEEGATAEACEERAAETRRHSVEAPAGMAHLAVSGTEHEEWSDAGQCRDCFLPAFNYRPGTSVQAMLTQRAGDASGQRFQPGLIGSSDNHTARPGTGYKEFARTEMADVRMTRVTISDSREIPAARGRAVDPWDLPPTDWLERRRAPSFFFTGGLVAAHVPERSRDALWDTLRRREVYATSGPRILLWFDLINAPGTRGEIAPMGSAVAMGGSPVFRVRAVGSRVELPGCPEHSEAALSPERLERLCRGECHHPSDRRRRIERIEVVRLRPQVRPDEPLAPLVEDPWRVLPCEPDATGCRVVFSDPDFASAGRDAVYYVRAIEEPSPAVNAGRLRCERDAGGRCVRTEPCLDVPDTDDCLVEIGERAWSSPIFVDHSG